MRRINLFFFFLFFPLIIFADNQPWQLEKSTHFLIYYKNAPEDKISELINKAEGYYDSITQDLGFNRFNFWLWDNRAQIYLYDTKQDYDQATNSLGWSAGQVIPSSKVINSFVTAPGFLNNVLPHELAHIILLEMVGFNNPAVPLWLQEGVASYQGGNEYITKANLALNIKNSNFINLTALSNFDLMHSADKEKVGLFYAQAHSLVKYLISEFGKDQFVYFCQNLRDNKDLTRALAKTYSFASFEDLQDSWKAYILK